MNKSPIDPETYRKIAEIVRVANQAAKEAREESWRMGVANVTSINGQIYYELPSGEITREQPAAFKAVDLSPQNKPATGNEKATTLQLLPAKISNATTPKIISPTKVIIQPNCAQPVQTACAPLMG